jgi:hypothetical protein
MNLYPLSSTDPVNAKRLSLCNCITTGWSDTVSAHNMTIDFFNKKVCNGFRVPVDNINDWPNTEKHVYSIPLSISTFLYSPFVDSYYPQYEFNNNKCRYNIGTKPESMLFREKHKNKLVDWMNNNEYKEALRIMDMKLDILFGSCIKHKILVAYDTSMADKESKDRVDEFQALAEAVLRWKTARIVDTKHEKEKWMWYSTIDRDTLRKEIERIENT